MDSEVSDRIAVFWHPDVLAHDTGAGFFEAPASPLTAIPEPHPEGRDRIINMHSVLTRGPVSQHIAWHDGRPATEAEILRFHEAAYVAELKAACERGEPVWMTGTSPLGPGSWSSIEMAAGSAIAAAEHVASAAGDLAYALVRPPGHHAAPGRADGYCFLNNTALAALAALAHGIGKVAILDWDVHHGNGTQAGFYDRNDVLTVSMHMAHGAWGPSHPETGAASERGEGAGEGFNLNVPLPYGAGDDAYAKAFDETVAPAVRGFAPDILVIACGQDAGQFDANGRMLLSMEGFHALGQKARALAQELCEGRIVAVQEGGYNISHSAYCLHATLEGLAGLERGLDDPVAYYPEN